MTSLELTSRCAFGLAARDHTVGIVDVVDLERIDVGDRIRVEDSDGPIADATVVETARESVSSLRRRRRGPDVHRPGDIVSLVPSIQSRSVVHDDLVVGWIDLADIDPIIESQTWDPDDDSGPVSASLTDDRRIATDGGVDDQLIAAARSAVDESDPHLPRILGLHGIDPFRRDDLKSLLESIDDPDDLDDLQSDDSSEGLSDDEIDRIKDDPFLTVDDVRQYRDLDPDAGGSK